jgi:hypothetical protein
LVLAAFVKVEKRLDLASRDAANRKAPGKKSPTPDDGDG